MDPHRSLPHDKVQRKKKKRRSKKFLAQKEQIPWTKPRLIRLWSKNSNNNDQNKLDNDEETGEDDFAFTRPRHRRASHVSVVINREYDGRDPRLQNGAEDGGHTTSLSSSRTDSFILGVGPCRREPLVYLDMDDASIEIPDQKNENQQHQHYTTNGENVDGFGEEVTEHNFFDCFNRRRSNWTPTTTTAEFQDPKLIEIQKRKEIEGDLHADYLALRRHTLVMASGVDYILSAEPLQKFSSSPFLSHHKDDDDDDDLTILRRVQDHVNHPVTMINQDKTVSRRRSSSSHCHGNQANGKGTSDSESHGSHGDHNRHRSSSKSKKREKKKARDEQEGSRNKKKKKRSRSEESDVGSKRKKVKKDEERSKRKKSKKKGHHHYSRRDSS